MTLAKLPDPKFTLWFRWTSLRDGSLDHEIVDALQSVGTYLIAHFRSGAPHAVDRTDANIFYIGETHGPTRSLKARLLDFGKSAGFLGPQRAGHYAAWAFPDYAKASDIDANDVYVAACPYVAGTDAPPDARGMFPTLVEAITLWSYTVIHGHMPALNNSGRQGEPEPAPAWDDGLMRSLLSGNEPCVAAEKLLASIAEAHGYAPRAFKQWSLDGWTGCERPFGGGFWGSIGWRGDVREVGMWLTNGPSYRFDSEGQQVTNETQLHALLDDFWRAI